MPEIRVRCLTSGLSQKDTVNFVLGSEARDVTGNILARKAN